MLFADGASYAQLAYAEIASTGSQQTALATLAGAGALIEADGGPILFPSVMAGGADSASYGELSYGEVVGPPPLVVLASAGGADSAGYAELAYGEVTESESSISVVLVGVGGLTAASIVQRMVVPRRHIYHNELYSGLNDGMVTITV
jgi:hypothetical protein